MVQSFAQVIAGHARANPDGAAYIEPTRVLTWAEYDRVSDLIAARFIAAGLKPGEKVGIYLPDGCLVHAAMVGAEKAGLVTLGLGSRAGLREVRHLMQVAGAVALVSHAGHRGESMADMYRELQADVTDLRLHMVLDEAYEQQFAGQQPSAADKAAIAERQLKPDQLWLLNSTSGTTGMPKCVVHDQLRWHAYHRHAVRSGSLNSKDVFLSAVPTPFGFGIWTAHVTPMLLGCPLVVVPKFSAEKLLEMIGTKRVSVVAAVSTQFIMMLNSPAMATADLSSLRILYTGGEAVPYNRASEFEDRTGATVLQFYGSNETGAFSYTTLEDSRHRRLTTAGKIMPEMQVRLFEGAKDVTGTGRGQPAGKGDVLSKGYYRNDEANRKLFTEDGWMLMEDIVTIDDEGYLTVVGRVGDFIIRGGKNVSAAAVEEAVANHPAVGVAAAVAAPDPVFGERVMLFVETKDDKSISLPEVVSHLEAAQASKEIYPEYLVVLPELPRAPGGKVAKGVLREEAKKRAAVMQPGSEAHG